jgi:predicted kinase
MSRIRIKPSKEKCFVVVSGLPGSGKTTLGQELALAMGLQFLDKDTILERLFESKGIGDIDWRRALSRESDVILQAEAATSQGAVLVSHWHLPGMAPNSGTPTNWLSKLSSRVVNVHCECPIEVAADRFVRRKRHPGHLDGEKSHAEVLRSISGVASLGKLDIVSLIDVDTSQTPKLDDVLREIQRALTLLFSRY